MKKQGFIKRSMLLLLLVTLAACDMQQEEERAENDGLGDSMIESEKDSQELDLDFVHIEKIENYEGMEMTDWMDEQTVVLAKENQELGKMSLLENAAYYPRSIYTYNLSTKEFKPVKTPKNMFLGGASLSSDKNHLLYYEYAIGDLAYYVMSLEDGELSSVKEDIISSAYTAEWTDQQTIIGASYSGGAYLTDLSGNVTQITELQDEQLFTVHKIQEKIYYLTTDTSTPQVYVLNLLTKEKKQLQLENVEKITLSPDGKKILFTQVTGETKRLIITDADGNVISTIAEGSAVTGASWSPNQQMVAYQLDSIVSGVERRGLYLYDVSTEKTMQIAQNVGHANVKWSPSGKKMVVTEQNERNYNSRIIYLK